MYHKGYTPEQALDAQRASKRVWKRTQKETTLYDKEIIVWDGEGMKLSGDNRPQHYVLFGCSARPHDPLVINSARGRLTFEEIADYALDVVADHPDAIHLGYFFKYDQNMIIWSLPWPVKQVLYSKGSALVTRGLTKYYIRMVFGKTIRITRARGDIKHTILIEDFAPFFASSFVKAYETLFKIPTDPENWEIVRQGKMDRSVFAYSDMTKVVRYWRAEILALHELAYEFRRIMFDAGFLLTQWHGPGALANYIRRANGLVDHEWGGKEENLPTPVHEAIKGAYYGGHFEQFKVGYIPGPIYAYDINSAYPHAFCEVPSLSEGGFWHNVGPITSHKWKTDRNLRTSFGVFQIRWKGNLQGMHDIANRAIQPFPHRSSDGNISYPRRTKGWYWAPEVLGAMAMALRHPDQFECEILDSWVWYPADDDSWPWEDLFREMYDRRRTLKRNKNPTQMAFKLGLNSLYGKMAQRAGGKEEAPKSHTLCIAGYITSTCRAKVSKFMTACKPDSVISVETDGVFTTTAPDELFRPAEFPLSDELGEWGFDTYDAMVMLQNGVYLLQKDGKWLPPKTRGISQKALQTVTGDTNIEMILGHLDMCIPGSRWEPMVFDGGESFIGLGTAIARATKRNLNGNWSTNPFKASDLHCTWYSDGRTLDIESRDGKRSHHAQWCRACQRGESPAITWHDMVIHTKAINPDEWESTKYVLPWEKESVEPQWRIMAARDGIAIESDLQMI